MTHVRLATIADAQRIAELMGELGYHAPAPVIERNLAVIATSPVDRVLVALVDDVIAGVVSLHVMDLFHIAGRIGRMTSLVVDTNHRGAGVGRQLVGAADAYFMASGCIRSEVTSGAHRLDAHAFYEAQGYAPDEQRFVKRYD